MAKREFLMTVDVEALPARARANHVDALIWGDFGANQREQFGVVEMMRLGDESGVPFSFFLDLAEVELYGDRLLEVGERVKARGQDLQLHLHGELLPEGFWQRLGLAAPTVSPYFYGPEHAQAMIGHFVALFTAAYGHPPDAYRGGSFSINEALLRALVDKGVRVSSNHAYGSQSRRGLPVLGTATDGLFEWDLGIAELPLGQVAMRNGESRELALPMALDPGESFRRIFESEAARGHEAGPFVMLLHSWSLLAYGADKQFDGPSVPRRDKLLGLLEMASELFDPISVGEFRRRLDRGNYANLARRTVPPHNVPAVKTLRRRSKRWKTHPRKAD